MVQLLRLRLLGRLNRLDVPHCRGDVEEDDSAVVGTTGAGKHERHWTGGWELLSCCRTAAYLTRAGTAPVGLAR